MDDLSRYEHKKRDFAYSWLMYGQDAQVAARDVAGSDINAFLKIAAKWPTDPEVQRHRKELLALHGEEHFLPSKAEIAKKLLDDLETIRDPELRLKFIKLYAELLGYLQKDTININNNITQNKVMLVPASQSDEEWQNRLVQQQERLLIDCEAINERTRA